MNIKPIRNEEDYQNALQRLDEIFDAKRGTEEGDELEILSILVDNYENEHFPIGMPDPIEAIKFRMEQISNADGFENKNVFILEQEDYELFDAENPAHD